MTNLGNAPRANEIEVSLAGPGYGECLLIHVGNHRWVVVDSCLDADRQPVALSYLQNLGFDPANVVDLIIATHWHDDHIRGMSDVVEACESAMFCCSSALSTREFQVLAGTVESRSGTRMSSAVREYVDTRSLLKGRGSTTRYAQADRLILSDGDFNVWSLSPADRDFDQFLQRITQMVEGTSGQRGRLTTLEPNDTSVVLLIEIGETAVLLGGDLERQGWLAILDGDRQVTRRASAFKVPHHGSEGAHEDRVWTEMLIDGPVAILTPWWRGGRYLPTQDGVEQMLRFTDDVYITAEPGRTPPRTSRSRDRMVEKTLRESGSTIRSVEFTSGIVRLRKNKDSSEHWRVERFGTAKQLA